MTESSVQRGNRRARCVTCARQYRVPAEGVDQCASCRSGLAVADESTPRPPRTAAPSSGAGGSAGRRRSRPEAPSSLDLLLNHAKVGPVEAAARAELEAAGRHEHPLGLVYLKLAHELDRSSGAVTQQITPKLMAARTEALAGAEQQADAVDDLLERKRAKMRGAAG